jgi:ABC-type sugar transport system substrate-binding protein
VPHLIVDGANVMGSRPDGWWRDRPGAAVRLAGQLAAALESSALDTIGGSEPTVHLVLEGAARQAANLIAQGPRLRVVLAPGDGDSAIVALAEELAGQEVTVVTADRELASRVQAVGAPAVGPRTLLARLP